MNNVLTRIFRLRPGEAGIVFVLGFLLLTNSIATQVSGVVAVSGFLSEVGVPQILIVWLVDYIIVIFTSSIQSLIVDRFDRISLLRWVLIGFAFTFVILHLLFVFHVPDWLNYSLLYLISDQQLMFFPLIFWILANDIFEVAQAKRLLPVIASFGFIGRLVGITIAAASPSVLKQLGSPPSEVLNVNVAFYLLAYVVVLAGLRHIKTRKTVQKVETLRETLTEGMGFIQEVPAFRYLTLAIAALMISDTIIEFRFLWVTDAVFKDAGTYQTFYSLYRLVLYVAAFFLQSFITSRIIQKINLKNTFLVLPFSVLAGLVGMISLPGVGAAVTGMILNRLPRMTVDDSARKAFTSLVPEERRGRVSIFLENYLTAAGTIVGSALTLIVLLLIPVIAPSVDPSVVYLAIAIAMGVIAVWAIFRMRHVYEASMLNWRLRRRQRGASVLNKLDF